MKDEVNDSEITEVVSVKAKQYAYLTEKNKCGKRCKGVRKAVVELDINFKDYKDCVFNRKTLIVEQKGIKSFNHELYTVKETKLALTSFNDKRFLLEDGINSFAYGHKSIPKEEAEEERVEEKQINENQFNDEYEFDGGNNNGNDNDDLYL